MERDKACQTHKSTRAKKQCLKDATVKRSRVRFIRSSMIWFTCTIVKCRDKRDRLYRYVWDSCFMDHQRTGVHAQVQYSRLKSLDRVPTVLNTGIYSQAKQKQDNEDTGLADSEFRIRIPTFKDSSFQSRRGNCLYRAVIVL